MKKIKTLGLIITLIMIYIGCEELPDPAGLRGVAVVPGISELNPGIFDSKDLENSYIEFLASIPAGTKVDKIVIQGSYKDNLERVTLTELKTYPATVRIKSAEAAQKLGIDLPDISNGDIFLFELVTTANGTTTRSSAVLAIPVACAYDKNLAEGSYHSVAPDWPSEGDITLTADPVDQYKIYVSGLAEIEGLDEDHGPLVMHINPITYAVVADETLIASDYFGYGSMTLFGTGVYSSCDGSYNMNLDISIGSYGNQGTFGFTLTRNP
jgi:hypothetical protein